MSIQINRFYHISVFGFGQGQLDFLVKNSSGIRAALEFVSNNFPGIENVYEMDFVNDSIEPKCEYLEMVDGNTIVMDGEVQIVRTQVQDMDCADDLVEFNPQFGQGFQMLSNHSAILWTHSITSVQKDFTWMVIA